MIIFREPQEITTWFLAFHLESLVWWMRLIPGRFKHVSAFAFAPGPRTWIFYDVNLSCTKVLLLPEGQAALERLAEWTSGCSVLRVSARLRVRMYPRIVYSCAGAIRHLLGLPGGAVRCDRLWDDCLREGAEIVHDGIRRRVEPGTAAHSDSGDPAAAAG